MSSDVEGDLREGGGPDVRSRRGLELTYSWQLRGIGLRTSIVRASADDVGGDLITA
jgi:hypothetical protein